MKTRYITSLIFSILFCVSCEDILDQEPLTNPVSSTFYNNETEATLAVNSIYDVLNGTLYRDTNPAALAMLEDYAYKGTNPNDGFGLSQINALNIESTNPFIESWYSGLYLGINRANIALDRISGIPVPDAIEETIKTRLKGEASFLRGLYYFYLVRLYGEVPIITSPSADAQAKGIPKSSEEEVWSLIESDFTDAINALPESYSDANIGRATSGAAKTFLAQVHMWQKEYGLALPLLEDVIASGQYMLEPDYINNFIETNFSSLESVFAIQYADLGNTDESTFWIRYIGVRGQAGLLRHPSLPESSRGDSGFGWYMYTKEILENFDENDVRRAVTFWENGQTHPDSPGTDAYDATKSSPFHLNSTDVGPKKWFWARKSYSFSISTNLALIRYADVLLLYAEVLNELNNGPTTQAYQSINLVRDRAGVTPYEEGSLMDKTSFFDAILRERKAEFSFEFQTWWTISRTRTAERFFENSVYKIGNFNEKHYKWPLPQQALDRNSELEQNLDY